MTRRYRICFALAASLEMVPELIVILFGGAVLVLAVFGYASYVEEFCK